jgi:hypothetical protein
MDIGYGRLQQHGLPGAAAVAELPPLSELLFLDAMWDEEGTAEPPCLSGVPVRAGGGASAAAGYAPAGARECAPAGSGLDDESGSAAAEAGGAGGLAAVGGHVRVCSHPLWPILVDYYFACRRVRARARCVACMGMRGARGGRITRHAAPHGWLERSAR